MSNRTLKKRMQAKRKADDYNDTVEAKVLAEELDMVNNMLKRVERAMEEDISKFQCSDDYFINHDEDDPEEVVLKQLFGLRRVKYFCITWNPDQSKDGPYQHISSLQLRWTPLSGEMSVNIRIANKINAPRGFINNDDHSHDATYQFGFSNTDTIIDMKKRFSRMYKRINNYWQEEVPKLHKQRSNDLICKMFPAIVDEIILGEMTNEEGDDRGVPS